MIDEADINVITIIPSYSSPLFFFLPPFLSVYFSVPLYVLPISVPVFVFFRLLYIPFYLRTFPPYFLTNPTYYISSCFLPFVLFPLSSTSVPRLYIIPALFTLCGGDGRLKGGDVYSTIFHLNFYSRKSRWGLLQGIINEWIVSCPEGKEQKLHASQSVAEDLFFLFSFVMV